jgi:hypothetical protein
MKKRLWTGLQKRSVRPAYDTVVGTGVLIGRHTVLYGRIVLTSRRNYDGQAVKKRAVGLRRGQGRCGLGYAYAVDAGEDRRKAPSVPERTASERADGPETTEPEAPPPVLLLADRRRGLYNRRN